MKYSFLIGEWISHVMESKNAHGLHSPFLFDLYHTVIKGKLHPSFESQFKAFRNNFINDFSPIHHQDFGAGSRIANSSNHTVSSIAKRSTKNYKEASLIARLIDYMQPAQVVELGTSFGSSSFLYHLVNPNIPIFTLEGSPEIAQLAQNMFANNQCSNINLLIGQFDSILNPILDSIKPLHCMILDGNHRMEPTISYFEMALQFSSSNCFFIFDDIRWSKEMFETWKILNNHSRVTLSIDLFSMGIIFLNPDLSHQKVKIRF